MTYEAPKVVASFAADAVLTEAAASGMAVGPTAAHSNNTAIMTGASVGVAGLAADLMSH